MYPLIFVAVRLKNRGGQSYLHYTCPEVTERTRARVIRDEPQDVPRLPIDVEADGELAQGEIHDKMGISIHCQTSRQNQERARETRHL